MWKKFNENAEELTEEEVLDGIQKAYDQLELVRDKLNLCGNVELRKKYLYLLADVMDTLDYS